MIKKRIKKSIYTWDSIATSFNQTRQQPWDFCSDYIKKLDQTGLCADFGCGNGRHLVLLAQQCKQIIGLDISWNLLKITAQNLRKKQITNTSLIKGDLCFPPFKTNTFNHIIYIAALHNITQKKNRIQSLKELYRVLKPEGTALISVWSRNQERFKNKKFQETNMDEPGDIILYWQQHQLNIPRFYHLYNKQEFKNDIQQTDFTIRSFKELSIVSKNSIDNYYAIVKKI